MYNRHVHVRTTSVFTLHVNDSYVKKTFTDDSHDIVLPLLVHAFELTLQKLDNDVYNTLMSDRLHVFMKIL